MVLNAGQEVSKKEFYKMFGLHEKATVDEIKKAYKRAARKYHPDTGGTTEQFQKLQEAYFILIDPDRRRIYDLTGRSDGLSDYALEKEAGNAIAKCFEDATNHYLEKIIYVDVIKVIRKSTNDMVTETEEKIDDILLEIEKLETARERLNTTSGNRFLFDKLDIMVSERELTYADALRSLTIFELALDMLDSYTFEVDEKPEGETGEPTRKNKGGIEELLKAFRGSVSL